MLDGVRAALDVFQPIVFERTAADLVAATATKQWREEHGVDMGYWLRRRLRKQSKDMLRPGRPVADLHAALLEVQAQREVWQAHCPSGGWPRLPDGLEHIEEEFAAVRADLDALDEVLARTPGGGGLSSLPFAALTERLTRLRADTDALADLPERTGLLHRLRSAGLGAARRRPGHPPDRPRRSRPPSWTWPGGARSSSRSSATTPRSPATTAPRSAPCPRATRRSTARTSRACPARSSARSSGTSRTRCASTASRPRRCSPTSSRSGSRRCATRSRGTPTSRAGCAP